MSTRILNAEIAHRNLKVIVCLKQPEPEEPGGDADFDPANPDLRAAGSVDNLRQTEWVKKHLNDAGVPCYFGPDLVELNHDQGRVLQTLNHLTQIFPAAHEEPTDFTVHCPKCNSTEVMLRGPESDPSEPSEHNEDREDKDKWHDDDADAEPAPSDARLTWKCDACCYEWPCETTESKS